MHSGVLPPNPGASWNVPARFPPEFCFPALSALMRSSRPAGDSAQTQPEFVFCKYFLDSPRKYLTESTFCKKYSLGLAIDFVLSPKHLLFSGRHPAVPVWIYGPRRGGSSNQSFSLAFPGGFLLRRGGVEHGMGREPWYLGDVHRPQGRSCLWSSNPVSGIGIKCSHSVCEPLKKLWGRKPQPTNKKKPTMHLTSCQHEI